jgi:hypothetical protein
MHRPMMGPAQQGQIRQVGPAESLTLLERLERREQGNWTIRAGPP